MMRKNYVRVGIDHIWPYDAWIHKATNTLAEYVLLPVFHCNNGCTNAPRCFVVRALSVLFIYNSIQPSPLPPLTYVKKYEGRKNAVLRNFRHTSAAVEE
jgi:hypothetical protein